MDIFWHFVDIKKLTKPTNVKSSAVHAPGKSEPYPLDRVGFTYFYLGSGDLRSEVFQTCLKPSLSTASVGTMSFGKVITDSDPNPN